MNNEEKQDYYIYLHKRKDNGVVFYAGHGRTARANKSDAGKTKDWKTVVSLAGGYEVVKLQEGLSKSKAIDLEEYYIKNPEPSWELVNKRLPTRAHELDFTLLSEFFYYDESSPSGLRYNKNTYKNKGALCKAKDSAAGRKYFDKSGKALFWRVSVSVGGVALTFKVHRIVWCLVNGSISSSLVIDHVDNNPHNNKIENLRLTSQHSNGRNKVPSNVDKKTGVTGLYKHHNSYQAELLDGDGNRRSKSFSINKYGEDMAIYLAAKVRYSYLMNQVEALKFTDSHTCMNKLLKIITDFERGQGEYLGIEPTRLLGIE